jgi:hypothetical protein
MEAIKPIPIAESETHLLRPQRDSEKGIALDFMHVYAISQSFVSSTIFDIVLYVLYLTSFMYATSLSFFNLLTCFLLLFYFIGVTERMDESKLETNVKSCGECSEIRYIFCVMYGKK